MVSSDSILLAQPPPSLATFTSLPLVIRFILFFFTIVAGREREYKIMSDSISVMNDAKIVMRDCVPVMTDGYVDEYVCLILSDE